MDPVSAALPKIFEESSLQLWTKASPIGPTLVTVATPTRRWNSYPNRPNYLRRISDWPLRNLRGAFSNANHAWRFRQADWSMIIIRKRRNILIMQSLLKNCGELRLSHLRVAGRVLGRYECVVICLVSFCCLIKELWIGVNVNFPRIPRIWVIWVCL